MTKNKLKKAKNYFANKQGFQTYLSVNYDQFKALILVWTIMSKVIQFLISTLTYLMVRQWNQKNRILKHKPKPKKLKKFWSPDLKLKKIFYEI